MCIKYRFAYRLCCDDGLCVLEDKLQKVLQQRTKNKTNIGQHSWIVLPNFANIAGEHKQQQQQRSNIRGAAAAWLASLYLTIVQLQSPLSLPSLPLCLPPFLPSSRVQLCKTSRHICEEWHRRETKTNERKHKESNSHSLTCHNSHTHTGRQRQSLTQS